jgi:hypothetical protein
MISCEDKGLSGSSKGEVCTAVAACTPKFQ